MCAVVVVVVVVVVLTRDVDAVTCGGVLEAYTTTQICPKMRGCSGAPRRSSQRRTGLAADACVVSAHLQFFSFFSWAAPPSLHTALSPSPCHYILPRSSVARA